MNVLTGTKSPFDLNMVLYLIVNSVSNMKNKCYFISKSYELTYEIKTVSCS